MKRLSIFIITLLTVLTASAQATKFDYIFEEGVRQKLANNYDAAIDLFADSSIPNRQRLSANSPTSTAIQATTASHWQNSRKHAASRPKTTGTETVWCYSTSKTT